MLVVLPAARQMQFPSRRVCVTILDLSQLGRHSELKHHPNLFHARTIICFPLAPAASLHGPLSSRHIFISSLYGDLHIRFQPTSQIRQPHPLLLPVPDPDPRMSLIFGTGKLQLWAHIFGRGFLTV